MGLIYKKEQRINGYECTFDYQLSPTAAMNYFQQTSQEQSQSLGVGPEAMDALGLAWFLVKYDLRFYRYPRFDAVVIVETEAVAFHKFAAHRRFAIRDRAGAIMVEADTEWMILERATGNLKRMDGVPENAVYCAGDTTDFSLRRLTKVEKWTGEKDFHVRYLDIDFNTHVNHVKYLAWALETLPLDRVKASQLASVKIIYKKQGFYGDVVRVCSAEIKENTFRVDVLNQGEEVLCQLEMVLAPKITPS